jgi:hypothetical protein
MKLSVIILRADRGMVEIVAGWPGTVCRLGRHQPGWIVVDCENVGGAVKSGASICDFSPKISAPMSYCVLRTFFKVNHLSFALASVCQSIGDDYYWVTIHKGPVLK